MEKHIHVIDKEKLELFKRFGVNRLSFGLETTSKKQLEFLERDEVDYVISKIKEGVKYNKKQYISNNNDNKNTLVIAYEYDNNIYEYADLIEVLHNEETINMWKVATTNTMFFNHYITSRRHRLKDSELGTITK